MKVRSILFTIATLALLTVPSAAVAQGGPGGGGRGGHGGPGGFDEGRGGGILRMLEHRLDHFAERLGLDEAQVAKIEEILGESLPKIQALVEEARSAREEWHVNHSMGDFDEVECRIFFEAQAAIDVEIKLASASTMAEVWAVLTPEQQAQLEEMRGGFGAGFRRGGGRRVK